jgi:hypothetical protein
LIDRNFTGRGFVGKVKSKGGDWRDFIILSDDFKNLLRKIWYEERKEMNDDTYLFNHLTEF